MPKNIAKELIAMHQERCDSIYFITGRTGSDCSFTTDYLKKAFDIKENGIYGERVLKDSQY